MSDYLFKDVELVQDRRCVVTFLMSSMTMKSYSQREIESAFAIPESLSSRLADWGVVCKEIRTDAEDTSAPRFVISVDGSDVGDGMCVITSGKLEAVRKLLEISFVLAALEIVADQVARDGAVVSPRCNLSPMIEELSRDFPRCRGKIYDLYLASALPVRDRCKASK